MYYPDFIIKYWNANMEADIAELEESVKKGRKKVGGDA